MAQLNTTELDFDRIKRNLINYFKRADGPFKDWDFQGSGLNHLMDLLAYNTHYNAILAHSSMNEAFLDSAQKRANVVSHAKSLGYVPSSKTGAVARLNITFQRTNQATSYTMPAGTKFSSTVGTKTYIFTTLDSHTVQVVDNQFVFNNIDVIQGESKTQTFTVDNSFNQRFVINDSNIDTSTLSVIVYDSLTATTGITYTKFSTLAGINENSAVYYLHENTDGKYEVTFGNGVFGAKPRSSGRVETKFNITAGQEANGANVFSYADTLSNLTIVSVTTVSSSAGGADPENNASIKFNAPLNFTAQDRAVTSSDYKALIKGNIQGLEDVLAWGGETENNPSYGTVYICAKPIGADVLTDPQKDLILAFLTTKKMIGVTPVIVDATFTYLKFVITFRYDQNATSLTAGQLAEKIQVAIDKYNAEELNNFNAHFRHSRFVNELDNADRAILSTIADVQAYKNVDLNVNDPDERVINFGFQIAGRIDQTASMIIETKSGGTSGFRENGYTVVLEDAPIDGDLEKRRVYTRRGTLDDEGAVVIVNTEAGFLYPAEGRLVLENLTPDTDVNISVTVRPASLDVYTDKRNILQIDRQGSTISGTSELLAGGVGSGSAGIVGSSGGVSGGSTGGGGGGGGSY